MRRFLSRMARHTDKINDALGVIALFALMIAGFWIAHGLGLPTGGDQLMGVV